MNREKTTISWPASLATSLRLLPLVLVLVLLAGRPLGSVWAGDMGEAQNPLSSADLSALNELLTQIGRQHVPNRFSDDRDWGETKERWDGLHMHLDGLKIKTKRRRKTVNHGTWKRFDVELVDPQREFEVRVTNLKKLPSGEVAFDLEVTSAVKVHGRLSRWNRGVQLVSLSADARAKVKLSVSAKVDVQLDFKHIAPDVVLDPTIAKARIELVEFEVDRFSKIGGDAAEQLGRSARGILQDKISDKQQKIVDKLNRSIDKRRDDLRLSMHDLLASQWGKVAHQYFDLPGRDGLGATSADTPGMPSSN